MQVVQSIESIEFISSKTFPIGAVDTRSLLKIVFWIKFVKMGKMYKNSQQLIGEFKD